MTTPEEQCRDALASARRLLPQASVGDSVSIALPLWSDWRRRTYCSIARVAQGTYGAGRYRLCARGESVLVTPVAAQEIVA